MNLFLAVTPSCNRDDAGSVGESLFRLGDALERRKVHVMVSRTVTPQQLWKILDDTIKTFDGEESFRHNHFEALSALELRAKT